MENAHLLRYPHPSSLQCMSMYASFLGISEALHLDIFHQPLKSRFFDSLVCLLITGAALKDSFRCFKEEEVIRDERSGL
jgi:hypothetical protein